MTRVYRIRQDERYQALVVPSRTEPSSAHRRFDATPLDPAKSPLAARVVDPERLPADLCYVDGGAIAVISGHAHIEGFLEMAGETWPLKVDSDAWVLANVLECINCLDRRQSRWRSSEQAGEAADIERYVFHASRLPVSSLFKIPETSEREVLVVERNGEPEDEFKAAVEGAPLTGITFELLWDDAES